MVKYFSSGILDKEIDQIDLEKSGRIVFNDRAKLDKLNAIARSDIYARAFQCRG